MPSLTDVAQPEGINFDFDAKCRVYRMPDGLVGIIDINLRLRLITYEDWLQDPNSHHWLQKFRNQRNG